jgi:hypothetical protein
VCLIPYHVSYSFGWNMQILIHLRADDGIPLVSTRQQCNTTKQLRLP